MDPRDLERLIDHELRQLPSPRAPRTLLPRVMRAVRTTAVAPAPAPGWSTWPTVLRVGTLAAAALIVLGVVTFWPMLPNLADAALAHTNSPTGARLAAALHGLDDILSAIRVLWRVLLQPVAVFTLVIVAVMSAACAVFGTALGRVALGGASRL
jgi:hypothetical protein